MELKRAGLRGQHQWAAESVSPRDCFIILLKCRWIYSKARDGPAEEMLKKMIYAQKKLIPVELSELLIKSKWSFMYEN